MKRLLQDRHDENHNTEREGQEICNNQNLAGSISETGTAISEARTTNSAGNEQHQIHPTPRGRKHLLSSFNCLSVFCLQAQHN